MQPLFKRIRAEVGGIVTRHARKELLQVITNGVVQLGIDQYATCSKGFDLGNEIFDRRPAGYYLLPEDLQELVTDANSYINTEVTKLTPRSALEHPVIYRVLPTGDLMLGINTEDFHEYHDDDSVPGDEAEV